MNKFQDIIKIEGTKINNIDYYKFIDIFKGYLKKEEQKTIFFINSHCVNIARKNKKYKNIINNSDLVLPDGIGVAIASFMKGIKIKENLNGTDLIPRIFKDVRKLKIFLLGGKPGVVDKMELKIKKLFPNIIIVGKNHGYFDEKEETKICKLINKVKPDLVLVAMGVPLQEKWIFKNKDKLNVKIFMSVGGLFDFMVGVNKRAPKWMRKSGLEWMYRIYQEPKRMWKRYIIGNPIFLYNTIKESIKFNKYNK